MSIPDSIDQEVMQQYRTLQQDGPCNMLDRACIRREANAREYYALLYVMDQGDYTALIKNYDDLADRFLDD